MMRRLSLRGEFAIVVVVAFGYFILGSVAYFLYPTPGAVISEAGLHQLLAYELVVLGMLLVFLHVRGWSFQRIGFAPSVTETLFGLGLAFGSYIVYVSIVLTASRLSTEIQYAATHLDFVARDFSLVSILAVSIVNPVFEEVFVCGYVVTALKERGHPWAAINISVAIRLLYHLYQGVLGIITVIPMGLIFAYCYRKYGRLWPLVVAHAAIDCASLLMVLHRAP